MIITPAVDASIQRAFLPHFSRLENLILVTVAEQANTVNHIRQTMLTEQMKREENAARLEADLQILRSDLSERLNSQASQAQKKMKDLQSELKEIKRLMRRPAGGQPLPLQGLSKLISEAPSETEEVAEPSIPEMLRPATPTDAYEDMFLRTLKDDPDPLVALIDNAPFHRMSTVLPSQGQPKISAPNVLALCVYIARDFPIGGPELGPTGKKRLAWLFSAIQATRIARQDSRYATFLPRVYTDTLHGISERRKLLTSLEDLEAVNAVLHAVDSLSMALNS